MLQLPAIPDPTWPVGKDDADNVVVRTWADPAAPAAPARRRAQKDHVALGTVARHPRLRARREARRLAQLRRPRRRARMLYWRRAALRQDMLVRRGYEPFVVPVLVTEQCMIGTGYFPAGRDQAYVTQDNTVLVGTSEVPLASFHGDEILERERPAEEVQRATSTCFRREAGAAGKDTAGLYRVHQFDKVEQVVDPQGRRRRAHRAARGDHRQRRGHPAGAEAPVPRRPELHRRHGPGQVADVRHRNVDAEPRTPTARRTAAAPSTTSRPAGSNLRYRPRADPRAQEAEPAVLLHAEQHGHRLPARADRVLEHYQKPDGSVTVPEVLRPYMGGLDRITR